MSDPADRPGGGGGGAPSAGGAARPGSAVRRFGPGAGGRWAVRAPLLAPLFALLLAACVTTATTEFQRHYEAGRYDDAASAFRADSSLHEDEEALYRMALMQSATDSPVQNLERARRTLRTLVELHPDGERSREARVLLALVDRVRELRTQLEELKAVDLEDEGSEESSRRP